MQSLAELALRMHESVDLSDEREVKKFLGFTRVGENLVGVRRRATRLMEEDAAHQRRRRGVHHRRRQDA